MSPIAVCVGCGLIVDAGLLKVHLDPAGGIVCSEANGLSATAAIASAVAAGAVGVSSDPCNGIIARDDGLYSSCPRSIVGTSGIQQSPGVIAGGGVGQLITTGPGFNYYNSNDPASVHICNDTCCQVAGLIFVHVGDMYFDVSPGFIGGAHVEININNGGFSMLQPSVRQTAHNNAAPGGSNLFQDIGLNYSQYLVIDPGQCFDFQWNFKVLVASNGSGTDKLQSDTGGPRMVTRWQLNQVGCCPPVL